LDDLGIIVTISWFCREFERLYSGLRIERLIDIEEEQIPEPLKIVIFRILQEAVNNVAKHSKADLVRISLKGTNSSMELVIEDNGQGFEIEHIRSADNAVGGVGLGSMKKRTRLSGGSFSIDSIKGAGTTIRASWQGGVHQ
jgi:signal transduction histidine kinase